MEKIIVLDDEEHIRNIMTSFLEKSGYEVHAYSDGVVMLDDFLKSPKTYGLVILDIMMPNLDGFQVMEQIRQHSTIPIIMVSAKDTEMDRVKGLRLGSDDYLVKPFSMMELIARIESIFRRHAYMLEAMDKGDTPGESTLRIGALELNTSKMELVCHEEDIPLTQTEYEMFKYLVENRHKVVSREDLLQNVWGIDASIKTRVTDDTLKRIRKKLHGHDTGVVIETVWGYGFIVKVEAETL